MVAEIKCGNGMSTTIQLAGSLGEVQANRDRVNEVMEFVSVL